MTKNLLILMQVVPLSRKLGWKF